MIVVGKRLNLDEMSQFRDAGITIEVRSNDHGIVGSKTTPAHVHVLDASGKQELAQIALTIKPPEKPSDIQWYRTSGPPEGLGQKSLNSRVWKTRRLKG
jgi:hypothetical protein